MNRSWSFASSDNISDFLSGVWQGYYSSILEPPTNSLPFCDQNMAAAAEDPFAIIDLPIRLHASINPKSIDIRKDENP
jgi:hypothetical protein